MPHSPMQLDFRYSGVAMTICLLATAVVLCGCGGPPPQQNAAFAADKEPQESPERDALGDSTSSDEPESPTAAANAEANSDNRDSQQEQPVEQQADPQQAAADENPFRRRIEMPEFPRDLDWINTSSPLRLRDLKGKFVVLDFWTYCCINCMHVLPELKKLEKAYPNELVVIGVHSAKFETEKLSANIEEAVMRYEIEHPVVNDADHKIWDMIGVRSWPTLLLIDPEGNVVWGQSGEVKFETLDEILKLGLPYYRRKNLLDETPIRFELAKYKVEPTPLRFPGKVLADEAGKRLFITDSNHNRIVIAGLDGKLIDVIGTGAIGAKDGGYEEASFDHPQGVALLGDALYVADTENHLIRKIDLKNKSVATIAGVGQQARVAWPGLDELAPGAPLPDRWVGAPKSTAINSPWALLAHGDYLYIAMAGPHQIWRMKLDESEIGPYAGNGREDIVDGPLLPQQPYETGYSSFAQPSGLASDGKWLYVADSEGSSVRAVPFDESEEVWTVVGTSDLPYGRLFEFGDVDGPKAEAKLQHVLCVAHHAGKLYVADTYNNKIKVVDAATGETRTLAGTGEHGYNDEQGLFDEPAGITIAGDTLYVADTNNHKIRTVNIDSGAVGTFDIAGLIPPAAPKKNKIPALPGAAEVQLDVQRVKPVDGAITLRISIDLPAGWKINALAPAGYYVETSANEGIVDRGATGEFVRLEKPSNQFDIVLPLAKTADGSGGAEAVKVGAPFYYCQEGDEGLCKVGAVIWTVPLEIAGDSGGSLVSLEHAVPQ